jgi:hypothetical protein
MNENEVQVIELSAPRMLVVPDSFDGLVEAVQWILDHHYPADVFTGESGDPGAVFVAKLREALEAL